MKQAKHRAVKASSQPRAAPLDMSSVSTKAPPENPRTNPPTRIFGLQDAPCYYPTAEEFMEPLKFIESIRPEAEKAGICKIIPPDGWKPPFALDTEVFRFKTRIQKLNSMEGETRTNLNYLDQLYKFHRQQGHPVLKIPQLDKRPIDLFRLRKDVAANGGYQKVTSAKKWAEIGRGLDYTRKQCTSLSNALKSAYLKVILPYEIYLAKQGKTEAFSQDLKREYSQDPSTNGSVESPIDHATPSLINMPETRKSKHSEPSSPSSSDRMSSEPLSIKRGNGEESDICEICQAEVDLDKMLICDGCELGYHTYCLKPPLQQIPKTDWYCAKCLVAGDDFGFEEGEEYSLSSFQQKCNNFKKSWFEKSGFKDGSVPEDVVEKEFWRLVENAYETVEVEYGADLHSTQHGSGFPSLERHPTDKYSSHPANLNNIPVLPESLFSHIKTDISGMMVPWLYVGMCFSTFCWHNEDHYTYSVNYMHWGDTKTWYGVPASDALKFEDTMKKAVPELFEQQPDLLFQLVTMLSPERLVENGVKVLALDQRPGQFVVTFPQAYHAGFNHGFNFAEAVNFAPPDWCPFGLECVQRYKDHRKQPVFSHDELIMTIALDDTSIATAYWLRDEMKNLLERELSDRKKVLKQLPKVKVFLEETDRPEEELCKCEVSDRFLRLRYSEGQLKEHTQRVIDAAAIPDSWVEKYRKIMMETRVPSLKLLRSLLAEADRIPFPIKEAGRLRRFVAVANDWVEATTKVLIRKHHQGRRLLDRAQDRAQGTNGRRLEDLQEMLRQVERLRFDCPEIRQLEESIEAIMEFQMEAECALSKPEHDLAECRELYESGVGMNIVMDEIDQLEAIVTDLTWTERVSAKGVLQEDYLLICSLVEDAERGGVSPSNSLLQQLIKKQEVGQNWDIRAQQVLNKNPVDLDELQAVIEAGRDLPVPKNVLSKAEQLYNKAMDWQKTVDQLMKRSGEISYDNRPLVSDLKRALKIADSTPIKIEHKEMFEKESKKFNEWMATCQELLVPPGSKKSVGLELEEALEDLKQNVEACTADEKLPTPTLHMNGVKGPDTNATAPKSEATGPSNKDMASVQHTDTTTLPQSGTQDPSTTKDTSPNSQDNQQGVKISETPGSKEPSGHGISSDGDKEEQIYCLCRTSESGMMVECDECHEWYHGPCVRVTKREASIKTNYICPICNLSLVIRRDKPRPTLDQLTKCSQDAEALRFFTPEVPLLGSIVRIVEKFREKVSKFLKQGPITEKDISQVKAYLRKIEGLEIELPVEREALRTHVLRLCPSSMPVPGIMLSTYPTAPPLSEISSNCYCAQRHAASTETKLLQSTEDVMIQCALCSEWQHFGCVGLDLEKVQKLSRFVCPVCCVVRKKLYAFGPLQYTAEIQAKASVRNQANKEATDAKRKKQKLSNIDPITGEERKKRPYKRREQTETGEKIKPKRRKSSVTQPILSPVSAESKPQVEGGISGVGGGGGSTTATTTLPSFSEGFLLPHDKLPPLKQPPSQQQRPPVQQQHPSIPPVQQQRPPSQPQRSPSQHPQRPPSHTLPPYPSSHPSPHGSHGSHGPPHYNPSQRPPSPQQHPQRYGPPHPSGAYRPYQSSTVEHVQRSSIHPSSSSHPISRGPAQSSHPRPHPPPNSHPRAYSHSSPPLSSSHLHSHTNPPLSHDHPGSRPYSGPHYGSISQGHYPTGPPSHQHQHQHHQHHHQHPQHHSQRGIDDHRSDMPHSHRKDPHGPYPHYPPPRPYPGYSNNGHGNQGNNSIHSPLKGLRHQPGHGHHVLPPAVTVGRLKPLKGVGSSSSYSKMDPGSGAETETDDDDGSPSG
ncbi:hypothetical protein BGZ46_007589, partial [Entomortierella lignicola]